MKHTRTRGEQALRTIRAPFHRNTIAIAALGIVLAASCTGPEISAPEFLPLYVDVSVEGQRAAEFRIVLDGTPAKRIDPEGGRVKLEVRHGRRVVELAGVPGACIVKNGRRRVVDVEPGRATFIVSFDVSCSGERNPTPDRLYRSLGALDGGTRPFARRYVTRLP